MTRFILSISLLVCLLSSAFSQPSTERPTTKLGPDLEQKKYSHLHRLLGPDGEGGTYAVKADVKKMGLSYEFALQHYGRNLRLRKSIPLETGKRQFLQATRLDDKVVVFSSNSSGKTERLYARNYSLDDLRPVGEPTQLLEVPKEKGLLKPGRAVNFRIQLSEDSSKILIVHSVNDSPGGMLFIRNKENRKPITVKVLDTSFQPLWEKKNLLPSGDDPFDLADFSVSEAGRCYLLFRRYNSVREVAIKGKANVGYELWKLTAGEQNPVRAVLDCGVHLVYNMQVALDDANGKVAIAGFYGDATKIQKAKGVICLWLSATSLAVESSRTTAFSENFIIPDGKVTRSKQKGIDLLVKKSFEITSDGLALLLAEQREVKTPTTDSRFPNYIYRDVVLVRFNQAAEVKTLARIPKYQNTKAEATFSSVAHYVAGEKVYLMFNDHRSNLRKKLGDKLLPFSYNHYDAVTVVVEVDPDGRQEKNLLFTGKKSEVFLRPDIASLMADGQVLAFGHWKKMHRLIRISIPGMEAASR